MKVIRNHDRILAFVYELHETPVYFPLHVLQLLKKFFGYNFSFFLPRHSYRQAFPIDRPYTQPHFAQAVSVGLLRDELRHYFSGPHKSGVFSPENMAPEFYARPVLLTDDILAPEDYSKTEAYADITRTGLGSPMLIQLNAGGMQWGSITLLRKKSETPFSAEDRLLAEAICPYITQAYKASVEKADLEKKLEFFRQYHGALDYGSIVVDNTFTVVDHNAKALAFCADALARYYKTNNLHERGYSILRGVGNTADVQSFVTRNQKRLLETLDKALVIYSMGLEQRYATTVKSLSTEDATGAIDIYYVIAIKAQAEEALNMDACLQYGLTNREIQLAALMVQGLTNKQISEQMFISAHTTKTHITKIFSKTGSNRRAELIYKLKYPAPPG
ncbi:MAG: helix-turn-helix transcriptional regulator [Ruminococcaceae bacterium]|nr:helix-turn-helix transcriptional regulator [Oscillospiraceae bacterium]